MDLEPVLSSPTVFIERDLYDLIDALGITSLIILSRYFFLLLLSFLPYI
jgi:hypothetical protein